MRQHAANDMMKQLAEHTALYTPFDDSTQAS